MPPAAPFGPRAPFQAIALDIFKLQGKCYLLPVDHFSNWPDIREAAASSENDVADGLIKVCHF